MSDSTTVVSHLHTHHHDDYDEAKAQIHRAIGSIEDIEIIGSQVLVAAYVRPNKTANGFYVGTKAQKEDIWQGKAVLVLKLGPSAFDGDEAYLRAMFGDGPSIAPDDWVFVSCASGLPISLIGDGGQRVKGADHRGDPIDIFEWDGWPCRVIPAESIIGRINKPHSVV